MQCLFFSGRKFIKICIIIRIWSFAAAAWGQSNWTWHVLHVHRPKPVRASVYTCHTFINLLLIHSVQVRRYNLIESVRLQNIMDTVFLFSGRKFIKICIIIRIIFSRNNKINNQWISIKDNKRYYKQLHL